MADAVTIEVQPRDPQKNKGTGSRVARRLRAQGRIPAIVYGHKQAPLPISMTRDDVWRMVKAASHLAQLKIGDTTEMVLVRDVQWDYLGKEIIHLDFARVSADERVTTEVPLALHGTAPGLSEGGMIDQPVHGITIECLATSIPDAIRVEIGELHLNQAVHARDLVLPEGVRVVADPDLVLVHIVSKTAAAAPEAAEGAPTEPEVIGRKPEQKEED